VPTSLFILGGARSGKSRFAITGIPSAARVAFVATAQARDAEMAARIARHQAERPSGWRTIEEPTELVSRFQEFAEVDRVIVDCITVWVANLMLRGDGEDAIVKAGEGLAACVARSGCDVTLVSNEVGEGVHPSTEDGRRFRDALGAVNQRLAAACDRVVLMVAGLPLVIKP
jgi:adenosylcobinamide kinase / adenosylcobinamide-phosphate guanylyltransferase